MQKATSSALNLAIKATLIGLTAVTSMPMAAQADDEDQSSTQAPQRADASQIEEIIVTARRREERLEDVPVAAAAVSAEQMAQLNITTLSGLRYLAPNLSIDRSVSGSGASISLRGVSSSHLDIGLEQSVLLYIDGMPLSRGRILNDALFDVEAVEVFKGPQALFFGKNSPAGVISVRSADPTDSFEGYSRMGYEFTKDTAWIEGALSGPLSDRWSGRLAVYGSDSDGFMHNRSPGVPDPFRTAASGSTFVPSAGERLGAEKKVSTRGTLKFANDSGFEANFKLLYSEFKGDGFQNQAEIMACGGGRTQPIMNGVIDVYGDCKLDNRVSKGYVSDTIIAAWPEARGFARGGPTSSVDTVMPTLTMTYAPNDDLTFTSITAYYEFDLLSSGQAGSASPTFFWSYYREGYDSLVQELRVDTDFDGMFNFSAGAFYSDSDRSSQVGVLALTAVNTADPATGKYNTSDVRFVDNTKSYSGYAQLRFNPIESVELAAGARYTKEEKDAQGQNVYVHPLRVATLRPQGVPLDLKKSENNTSPDFSASWRVSPDLMVYAAYRTGYLAGGFGNPTNLARTTTAATLEFDEETAEGFEAGVKFTLPDHNISGSLAAYQYDYEGLQLTSFNAANATFQTQNAADTRAQGVELEGTYQPLDALSLRASLAWNDTYFESFPGSQCYAGQTAAQGCVANRQDLSGREMYRAPEWTFSGGARYEFPVGEFLVDVSGDVQYISDYYVSLNLNPGSQQEAFYLLNAGVGLTKAGAPWRVAVIGKNLADETYGTLGNDSAGQAGDTVAVTGDPRTMALQLEYKF